MLGTSLYPLSDMSSSEESADSTNGPPERSPILGIDLGTTNSLVAIFDGGAPRLLPNSSGEPMTPSVVGLLSEGGLLVGQAAAELRVTAPDRCASFFKRWMGSDRKVSVGESEYSAIELSSMVLKAIKDDASATLGVEVSESVVTVPAYFNDHQRAATRAAAELAGLTVLRIVNEPTAAALTYGFHEAEAEKRLLVFDLGGGTFDVTLMEIFEGQLEIQATAGESQLGGEDFTDALTAWAFDSAGEQAESVALFEPLRYARLRAGADALKRSGGHGSLAVPDREGRVEPGGPVVEVTAVDLEKIYEPLLDRLERPLLRVLSDARVLPDEVDEVLLVGGATRMPEIPALVERIMGKAPQCRFDPDHVVALGAAVQGALIAEDAAVEDMVATDVSPHTLGIEISREFGSDHRPGYYLPVIHRNTTIPVSDEVDVGTISDNQERLSIRVFQGEGRMVADNLPLGTLAVTGIPKGPSGQQVTVRFSYDASGLLEVEAIVAKTGERFQAVMEQSVKSLSAGEIERALKRLAGIKFYPRHDALNVELLAFANRVVGELSRFQREPLDEGIDRFESELYSKDRDGFEAAREDLLALLDAAGFPFREES